MKSMTFEEEKRLLAECIRKNGTDEFYKQYQTLVKTIIRRQFKTKSIPFTEQDVEDVCHDVFVRIFEKNSKFLRDFNPRKKLSLGQWIGLAAHRTFLNHIRSDKNIDHVSRIQNRNTVELLETIADSSRTRFHQFAENKDFLEIIRADINELPNLESLVMKLHYFDGVEPAKISAMMNRNISSIYTAKSRAVKKLRKKYQDVM